MWRTPPGAAPNIYLETSGHWPSFIVEMVQTFGSERILFGSDSPMNLMDWKSPRSSGISQNPNDRENILHRTAETLFGKAAYAD